MAPVPPVMLSMFMASFHFARFALMAMVGATRTFATAATTITAAARTPNLMCDMLVPGLAVYSLQSAALPERSFVAERMLPRQL